jgi:hypothetical protein
LVSFTMMPPWDAGLVRGHLTRRFYHALPLDYDDHGCFPPSAADIRSFA